jgi:hypothetical protein
VRRRKQKPLSLRPGPIDIRTTAAPTGHFTLAAKQVT